ncbi:MAG: DeoR/GlpR family DNA-binding transcription regulator [Anaerolineae bacterium]
MSTVERRAAISQRLAEAGVVEVADLVVRFDVSAPTIRRDLTWLEKEGLARRVHGGALVAGQVASSRPDPDAVPTRIGRAAAKMVADGETVFVGPGRLGVAAARALADRQRLTVVTNGLEVAQTVVAHSRHTLIVTGGQLERQDLGLEGALARDALSELRADRIFLELGGVSAVEGLTDDSLPQAELESQIIELGAQVVVLVEPDRVGRVAAAHIGPASDADVLVTAREADSAPLWDLTELGVRIILA